MCRMGMTLPPFELNYRDMSQPLQRQTECRAATQAVKRLKTKEWVREAAYTVLYQRVIGIGADDFDDGDLGS